jgi:hypothetical protein
VSVKPVYGTLADFSYSVKANVSVVESDATISSINDITKTINQGDSYSLPTTVNATMSDTTTKSVNVTWSPSTADTSKAGTQTFNGSVVGYSGMVKLTITINSSAPTISSIADITHIILVKQGDACSLPSEVEATLSEGTKKQVPITWNPSIVDTSKVGRYTFLGSVEGTIVNGSKPTCTIIVKDPSELILPIGGILNGDNNWNNNTIYLQSDLTIKNQLSLGNVTIMGNGHRIINYGSINIYGDVIVINATLDIYQGSVQFGDNGRLEYM